MWRALHLALVVGTLVVAVPPAASAQHHGSGLIEVSGAVGAGGVFLGLFREDALLPDSSMNERWLGRFQPFLGFRVDQTTLSITAAYHLNTVYSMVTLGGSVAYTFLEEQLTPVARAGLGLAVLDAGTAEESGVSVGAVGVMAELSGGVRLYASSAPRSRRHPWLSTDWFFQLELGTAYTHLVRGSDEEECGAPCEEDGIDLARSGSGDGLSVFGLLSFGFVTG